MATDCNPRAIRFRGKCLEGRKYTGEGTPRGAATAETMARLRPHFGTIGLTRIAHLTGFDRIGIPVTLAIRPNSPDIGANSGKGFTREAAEASAAMEAFEHHCGEFADLENFEETYDHLSRGASVISLQRLGIAKNSLFHTGSPERWTMGWDLIRQLDTPVPYDRVRIHYPRHFALGDMASFQSGTNGLAAGNNLAEAVTSALLELVERDARACHYYAHTERGHSIPRLRPETISYSSVCLLLQAFDRAGVDVIIFDQTTNLKIPSFEVAIFNRQGPPFHAARGWGAHLDVETALVRALTEAAQVRLVHLCGVRDDALRRYHHTWRTEDCTRFKEYWSSQTAFTKIEDLASVHHENFEQDIAYLLARLTACGLGQAVLCDLTPPGFDLAAARMIVPGLEGYLYEFYTPGERARDPSTVVR